ncbi:MAG TPA: alpha/beta hydrolase, partial [Thermomicrobiales bacterium]|nr:alpha/beta hydrolase [Thermomicrobiales bacterium]
LAGASSMSSQWAWVQAEVASFARVVSYDRAGLGWSDASDRPGDARTVATELHTLLHNARVPGPYVLVGHSLGGAHARVFADMYRDEVAGMVLIDAANPEFWTRVEADALDKTRATIERTTWFPHLSRFGILRVMNPAEELAKNLPAQHRKAVEAIFPSVKHTVATRNDYQEIAENSATMAQLRQIEPVGDLPLAVLTRTEPDDAYTLPQQQIDAALAATSNRGSHHLVENADHFTIVTNEEHARTTAHVIKGLLERLDMS